MAAGGLYRGVNAPFAADVAPALRRRPIRLRGAQWVRALAGFLARRGVRPNQISLASVVWALAGACALIGAGQSRRWTVEVGLLLLAGGCVQMRLLCNLLDGLVAVEGGMGTKTGEIFNELPDRVSDVLLLAAAGFVSRWTGWERDLGWAAAALAVGVAYVRALGGQMGAAQQFCGPMAKQQRMFVLTLACITTAAETGLGWPRRTMTWALAVIVVGAGLTMARRTRRIARELDAAIVFSDGRR